MPLPLIEEYSSSDYVIIRDDKNNEFRYDDLSELTQSKFKDQSIEVFYYEYGILTQYGKKEAGESTVSLSDINENTLSLTLIEDENKYTLSVLRFPDYTLTWKVNGYLNECTSETLEIEKPIEELITVHVVSKNNETSISATEYISPTETEEY